MKSILLILFLTFSAQSVFCAEDSGTFRGNWWNYYERGVQAGEKGTFRTAEENLSEAISMRSRDQRMARTYGMHFIDYFPHRELGIVYLNSGDAEKAIFELEESIKGEESAKAFFYLNKARKMILLKKPEGEYSPARIFIRMPAEGAMVGTQTVRLQGSVMGEAYISKIRINGRPVRLDVAKKEITLDEEVVLDDGLNIMTVTAEDLLGRQVSKNISVRVNMEGPSITIYDMVGTAGGTKVMVSGEIYGESNIKAAYVNGKAIGPVGGKTVPLNIILDQGETEKDLFIEAEDMLGNKTEARVKVSLALQSLRSKPVLIAFTGKGGILSSDSGKPSVELRNVLDMPQVFIDTYYVEFPVTDPRGVDRVLINGKKLSIKKGKEVFIGKTFGLKEGKNDFHVEAYNSAGGMTAAKFTITRAIPSVMQQSARMSVSVLPFDGGAKEGQRLSLAFEKFIGYLVDQKRFSVVDRSKMEQVLLEQKLTKVGLSDPEHSVRIGRILAAEAVLATNVNETPSSLEVVTRVINTETSEVMASKDAYTEDKSRAAISEMMEGLASKVASGFPIVQGRVIDSEKRVVYTDIGEASKVKVDAGVIIYRNGKEVKDPHTGKSLGSDPVKIAEGRIESIQKDFSKVRLSNAAEVSIKDMVITK